MISRAPELARQMAALIVEREGRDGWAFIRRDEWLELLGCGGDLYLSSLRWGLACGMFARVVDGPNGVRWSVTHRANACPAVVAGRDDVIAVVRLVRRLGNGRPVRMGHKMAARHLRCMPTRALRLMRVAIDLGWLNVLAPAACNHGQLLETGIEPPETDLPEAAQAAAQALHQPERDAFDRLARWKVAGKGAAVRATERQLSAVTGLDEQAVPGALERLAAAGLIAHAAKGPVHIVRVRG